MIKRLAALIGALVISCLTAATAAAENPIEEAGHSLYGRATQVVAGGGGGRTGGPTATTARTHTFSSAAYVDYKRRGGEPTGVVDRYPFPGSSGDPFAQCPSGQANCFKDLVYVSAPEGLPGYSFFWKSEDLGGTFRLPQHLPATSNNPGQGIGGGDSHQAIGELTHNVFFIDLPGDCVTFNRSTDLGESFSTDILGCGLQPGAIDDRQWVDADEGFPGSKNVYVSFIDTTTSDRTLALARSQADGAPGSFAAGSVCNTLTQGPPGAAAPDATPTPCPDPRDPRLRVAGPVVADKAGDHSGSHIVY